MFGVLAGAPLDPSQRFSVGRICSPPRQVLFESSATTDKSDQAAVKELGDASLEFGADGKLKYTIAAGDKAQVMLMTYVVEDGVIVTDQPSAPRVERTNFSISPDGVLTLAFGGVPYRFRRQ